MSVSFSNDAIRCVRSAGLGDSSFPPLSYADFARRMAALGADFAPRKAARGGVASAPVAAPVAALVAAPVAAVAVSGGPDSMALTLLAQEWIAKRGGSLLALTVDHGLRPESRTEARQVHRWLLARGISHKILTWRGAKPTSNLQAEARALRYQLLSQACAKAGIKDLLLAHQLEDQAETFLLRLARGSGLDGLAAMAGVSHADGLRLLRPLLDVPRACLIAYLEKCGQEWISDPSNLNSRHARVRLRALSPILAQEGLTAERLAATATRLGRAREALTQAVDSHLARSVRVFPEGWARMEPGVFLDAPDEVRLRALSRLAGALGGAAYPPRLESVERLDRDVREGVRAATLAGCRLWPEKTGEGILLAREAAGGTCPVAGFSGLWDGRFTMKVQGGGKNKSLFLAPLGQAGLTALYQANPDLKSHPLPRPVRLSLPALWDGEGPIHVPHMSYARPKTRARLVGLCFSPRIRLAGEDYCLVPAQEGTMSKKAVEESRRRKGAGACDTQGRRPSDKGRRH